MIHTAQPVSNAFSVTQKKRYLDVYKAVLATLAVVTTATTIQVRSSMRFPQLRFRFPAFFEYGVAWTSHHSASYTLQHPLPHYVFSHCDEYTHYHKYTHHHEHISSTIFSATPHPFYR